MHRPAFKIILTLCLLFLVSCGGQEGNGDTVPSAEQIAEQRIAEQIYQQLAQSNASLPTFELFDSSVLDQEEKTVVERRLVLLDEPTEANVRALLDHHYAELSEQRGFENHTTPTDIIVIVYGSHEQADQNPTNWLGSAIKATDDVVPTIEITVN